MPKEKPKILRHWIIAGATPRMTTENALDAEPASFENSVLHHRLNHILTARRGVAARRRRERRYAGAVEIHREKEYVTEDITHCI